MMKTSRLVGCLLAAGGVVCASQADAALVAHYTFDTDATATVGTDATLGEAGSIDNADFVDGGGSLKLDSSAIVTDTAGNDGAVSGNSFDWSASDVRTVTFFMKAGTQTDANRTMISLGSTTGTGARFDIRLQGDNLRLEVQGGGTTTASNINDGEWHHVAIVVPNAASTLGDVSYYIDGALVGTFAGGTAINTATGPLRLGDSYQDTSRDFVGNLDDVRVYDEALDASAIAGLANVPEPGSLALLGLGGLAMLRRRR